VRKDEAAIEARLRKSGFFSELQSVVEGGVETPSVMRFDATRRALAACGFKGSEVQRACLFLIGRGAFCDAHVVNDLAPEFASDSAA